MKSTCPCHSGQLYQACCQIYHLGQTAPNAEKLMRSRYSAYVLKLAGYLQHTWHTSTRHTLTQADFQGIKWLGLQIMHAKSQDSNYAIVMFKARFKHGKGKTQVLHETSRFVLENGQWFYVDGVIHTA